MLAAKIWAPSVLTTIGVSVSQALSVARAKHTHVHIHPFTSKCLYLSSQFAPPIPFQHRRVHASCLPSHVSNSESPDSRRPHIFTYRIHPPVGDPSPVAWMPPSLCLGTSIPPPSPKCAGALLSRLSPPRYPIVPLLTALPPHSGLWYSHHGAPAWKRSPFLSLVWPLILLSLS